MIQPKDKILKVRSGVTYIIIKRSVKTMYSGTSITRIG